MCRLWLEFVPSEQKWTDGISRNGSKDDFAVSPGSCLPSSPCNASIGHGLLNFRDRDVFFFVDHTACLHALAAGSSGNEHLD